MDEIYTKPFISSSSGPYAVPRFLDGTEVPDSSLNSCESQKQGLRCSHGHDGYGNDLPSRKNLHISRGWGTNAQCPKKDLYFGTLRWWDHHRVGVPESTEWVGPTRPFTHMLWGHKKKACGKHGQIPFPPPPWIIGLIFGLRSKEMESVSHLSYLIDRSVVPQKQPFIPDESNMPTNSKEHCHWL